MIALVTTSAVNIERMIPRISVSANPLIEPVPPTLRTMAIISVVIFPSRIEERALLYPFFLASSTAFPYAISSLILANTRTFASTAIPIERMIPAIPGRVSVISNAESRNTISPQ